MTLLNPDGPETTTFVSMLSQIRSLAYRLGVEGIDFGDRVAIIGENDPIWAIAYLGIIYRGAVVVPLDPSATIETLAAFLENSEAKLAFVSPQFLERFRAVAGHMRREIRVVNLKAAACANGDSSVGDWAQTTRPPEFDAAKAPATATDNALLIYTSGTTGSPKAVQLTHGNIHAQVDGVQEVMGLTDEESFLSVLPLFHAYSQIVNLWLATVIGLRVVYLPKVDSEEIARGLKEGGITGITGVPRLWYLFHKRVFDAVRARSAPARTVFKLLLRINGWLRDGLGVNAGRVFFRAVHEGFGGKLRLAISAGSSFDPEVAQDYHRLGFTILQGYGLTETSGAATVTRFEDNKIGSVGTALNSVAVKIDQPNSEGVGEVLIRGEIVTPGYYRNPEANREAFTEDGWFRSGDLGRFDTQGHLFIVGRQKDVIVLPSGKNVHPEDVEAHYAQSPFVSEICVLGVSDRTSEFAQAEKLCAVIVPDFEYLRTQRIANAREIIRFDFDNRGRALPEYQRVRDYIVRAEPLPRTAIRKVRRFELREQIEKSAAVTRQARDIDQLVFTPAEHCLMETPAGRALSAAIRTHVPDVSVIHPQMNLELDLGLDSLARAECIASIAQNLGVELDSTAAALALTVAEVVTVANGHPAAASCAGPAAAATSTFNWSEILGATAGDASALASTLKINTITSWIAYLFLRFAYLAARIFLRMEVRGLENLVNLERPFIVCPNHQSYLDPLLVCATYPPHILRYVFHVGASEYWNNPLFGKLATRANIVPVDPDTNLLRAMRACAAGLRAGMLLNIYPEGERSFDGFLHIFKKGAAILASELDVPLIPVALDGLHKVWPRQSSRIRLAKVKIHFGEPIRAREVVDVADEAARHEKLTALLKERIQTMLDDMRRE